MLFYAIVLLVYIPFHLIWGNPLYSKFWYYAFGFICGLSVFFLRKKNLFWAFLPFIAAPFHGNFVLNYAEQREWVRIKVEVEQFGAMWEWDKPGITYAINTEILIALGLALVIIGTRHFLAKRKAV